MTPLATWKRLALGLAIGGCIVTLGNRATIAPASMAAGAPAQSAAGPPAPESIALSAEIMACVGDKVRLRVENLAEVADLKARIAGLEAASHPPAPALPALRGGLVPPEPDPPKGDQAPPEPSK